MRINLFCFLLVIIGVSVGHAFEDRSFSLGAAIYSQNSFYKTTKTDDGEASLTGASSYPLLAKYDWQVGSEWFLAPQIAYTVTGRATKGDSAKTSFLQLILPCGKNFEFVGSGEWDWAVGVGATQYTIQGEGGTIVLNNGTSSANFGKPSRAVSMRTSLVNLALAYSQDWARLGFDLNIEGLLSQRRTGSLMVSFLYRFGSR